MKKLLSLALISLTAGLYALNNFDALMSSSGLRGPNMEMIVDTVIGGNWAGLKMSVNDKDSNGRSLIELLNVFAPSHRKMALVEKVIMAPGFDINGKNFKIGVFSNLTLLMGASMLEDLELVTALLKVPGIDINAKDAKGKTALFYAKMGEKMSKKPNTAVIDKLKAAGATE